MVFASTWTLFVFVPLWVLVAAAFLAMQLLERRGRFLSTPALSFGATSLALALPASRLVAARRVVQALRLLTLALLLLALARPQKVLGMSRDRSEGIDIVLALDTSGSMRALDLDADKPISERRMRLGVVQDVVKEFVDKRPVDQIGMVVFGAEAFMQCPLTLDHGMVATLLDRLEIGMAGDQTAIGSGIAAAVNRLKKSTAKSKVIILLTDGMSNTGPLSPKKASEVAAAFGIRIYTIGAGTRGKAPFIVDNPLFGKRVAYDEVSIDEDGLKEVAATTGGEYFRAEDSKALAEIYDHIDKLEKSRIEGPKQFEVAEQARWAIIPALALLLFETILLHTRLRRVP